ncbi:hypothetical protein P12x_004792 [Tundrisphaera lichenicola]|uniref:hypothetical protein n=1 Tax=Tundrisphaera lichenicola TaxID=2029860 RepID=UPI003EBC7365
MMIFAYFGPETTLPVVSVIAAAAGFVLTGGRFVTSWLKRRFRPRVDTHREVRSIASLKRSED